MKNYIKANRFISLTLLTTLSIIVISYILFQAKCFSSSCGTDLLRGLIKPAFWLGVSLTPLIAFFLFFPEAIFRLWLKRIAWWYGIMTFIFVANTSIYSSHIMSMSRAQVVIWCISILAIITIPFVLVMNKKLKTR